ncbi:MAG: hypothetical protein AABN95_00275 [Acidobacteriota bacterium]
MDLTLKIALIAAASAVLGGLVTAVIAPHVAWGIEKRRNVQDARKELIHNIRRMIVDYRNATDTTFGVSVLGESLSRNVSWLKVKPYLREAILRDISEAGNSTIQSDKVRQALSILEDEITHIQKMWKLV